MLHSLSFTISFLAISWILPGVPITMWTVLIKRNTSSFRDVPPVDTITSTYYPLLPISRFLDNYLKVAEV